MVRLALALLVSTGLAGCAHAPPATPAPIPVAQPRPPDRRDPTGLEVERILAGSGLAYVTVEPGRKWAIPFAGRSPTVVWVVHGTKFTLVMGKVFTVTGETGVDLYKALARRNYDLDQVKLSVDEGGTIFASYEVPTRILDDVELLEDIYGLAGAIESMHKELAPLVDPDTIDTTPEPLPTPGPPKKKGVGVPLLEVRGDRPDDALLVECDRARVR